MCGICGYITNKSVKIDNKILEEMTDAVSHRGPDGRGFFNNISRANISVGFGHRRLSIIDLSDDARQPMSNESGTIWIVFNGEIYNFLELKPSLLKKGHTFKSASDTEVILHLYEEHKEKCLDYLNGMFVFAIWDSTDNSLFAARDRMGEKPFFYTSCNGVLLFASEIKSILKYPEFKKELDILALQKYLAYEYIPAPRSVFKNVFKLPAGHSLKWHNGEVRIEKYWDLELYKSERPFHLSENECADKIKFLLSKSIEQRLISDVPLGVFLSGGLDSSVILALMSKLRDPRRINTFSIGFEDKSFDESSYARNLACLFKTNHHEEILTANRLIEVIPRITDFLDEPLGDASIIPTYLLSAFTRKYIKVAIGGDGGDELFAGYPTFQADKAIDLFYALPHSAKNLILKIIKKALPVSYENISFDFKIKQFLKGGFYSDFIRHFVWMGSFTPNMQMKLFKEPDAEMINNAYDDVKLLSYSYPSRQRINTLLYLYTKLYLQNDLLAKVDTASMLNSLEVRSPFLDLEFIKFMQTVPVNFKIRNLTTKYILRKGFSGVLPDYILKRPKKGFGIPVAKWFRGELKNYLLSSLSEKEIEKAGIFNYKFINSLLDNHFSNKRDNRKLLWTLLIFQQWYKKNF